MKYIDSGGWVKKGLIYRPSGELDWSKTHAQVPVFDYIKSKDIVRVYFSTRNKKNMCLPGFVDLDPSNFSKILNISKEPILNFGELGTFDDCGVMPSWIIEHEGCKYMYYIGWNVRNTIPYHNAIGLAISKDDGLTYSKFSNGPLWDRDHNEPHYSGTSCVLIDSDGMWKNYYLSCTEWRIINNKSEPRYHIKLAESIDGVHWVRKGKIVIDYNNELEAGIVKASVIFDDNSYKMWYSYRNFDNYRTDKNNSYKIGYAESENGVDWERKDSISGIYTSEKGWDSEMIEYPHVFSFRNKLHMLYNGNGFGKSGFGYATWENK